MSGPSRTVGGGIGLNDRIDRPLVGELDLRARTAMGAVDQKHVSARLTDGSAVDRPRFHQSLPRA